MAELAFWPVVQTLNFSQVGGLIQPCMLVQCEQHGSKMLSSMIVTAGSQGFWPVVQTLNFPQVGAPPQYVIDVLVTW
jgi:hypothetical protein